MQWEESLLNFDPTLHPIQQEERKEENTGGKKGRKNEVRRVRTDSLTHLTAP